MQCHELERERELYTQYSVANNIRDTSLAAAFIHHITAHNRFGRLSSNTHINSHDYYCDFLSVFRYVEWNRARVCECECVVLFCTANNDIFPAQSQKTRARRIEFAIAKPRRPLGSLEPGELIALANVSSRGVHVYCSMVIVSMHVCPVFQNKYAHCFSRKCAALVDGRVTTNCQSVGGIV